MFKNSRKLSNELEYFAAMTSMSPVRSWLPFPLSPQLTVQPFPPKLIGQLLLLGHDAGGIDGHEEEVRLLWGLCATGAVQQKLVHKDLGLVVTGTGGESYIYI